MNGNMSPWLDIKIGLKHSMNVDSTHMMLQIVASILSELQTLINVMKITACRKANKGMHRTSNFIKREESRNCAQKKKVLKIRTSKRNSKYIARLCFAWTADIKRRQQEIERTQRW